MKPFWISAGILLALFLALLCNVRYLKEFITPLHEDLEQAAVCVREEDWENAERLTRQVHDAWYNKKTYLQITLKHADIDSIYVLLEEVLAYLEQREIGEYMASNQTLIAQLTMLYEMEELTLHNIL